MKRTTLVLEEGVLESIREEAHNEGIEMSRLVNDLLIQGLARKHDRPFVPTGTLPSFSMGRTGANLADRDALEQLMES